MLLTHGTTGHARAVLWMAERAEEELRLRDALQLYERAAALPEPQGILCLFHCVLFVSRRCAVVVQCMSCLLDMFCHTRAR
jgi:hypothetical protein